MPLGAPPKSPVHGPAELVRTTCPYCGVGCGVDALRERTSQGTKLVSVTGTPEHPANFGRLCIKGTHLRETNGIDGRMLYPQVEGQRVEWDEALSKVASALTKAVERHGPDSVAFYVSGQLLTEDYYVANKLMKGYIGSANIDTNSRLCMSSAVAGHKRAFGADAVPVCYEDLEQAELLVLVGSNAAWTHPVLFQRLERARQLNPNLKLVVIDPRATDTCSIADLHLALRAGSDVALFNGLLRFLDNQDALDKDFLLAHTEGLAETLKVARRWSEAEVADACHLDESTLRQFYQLFAATEKTMTLFCMGVNQSVQGVDKVNSIINVHLATGRIGKAGAGPFSLTGQPNAMGGREVGGLANMLAAHMDIDNPQHRHCVQAFWQSPTMADRPGLKAMDLFQKAADGQIKVLWIMATNPMVSMPDRALMEKALARCDTVIVSDCVSKNDTLSWADIALPAAGWSEKDGTVTNSERCISRQRGLQLPAGEARPDWQIMCDVAKRMGFDGFDYVHPYQIFSEHAALSGKQNTGNRAFDISGLAGLSRQQYDRMLPIQWPVNAAYPQGCKRLFEDGRFYTSHGKANLIPTDYKLAAQMTSDTFPFVFNTGRFRDQWHTMTRTGKADVLLNQYSQPVLLLHPEDAGELAVAQGQLVKVQSQQEAGQLVIPVKLSREVAPGSVFAPIHWHRSSSSHGVVNTLLEAVGDPLSGQPELKHGAVRLMPLSVGSYFRVYSDLEFSPASFGALACYVVVRKTSSAWCYSIASENGISETFSALQHMFTQSRQQWMGCVEYESMRSLGCDEMQLRTAIWGQVSPFEFASEARWLNQMQEAGQQAMSREHLSALLSGQSNEASAGLAIVCQCHQVSKQAIESSIASGNNTLQALGRVLGCGTGCGSCRSELRALLRNTQVSMEASS